MEAIVYDKGKLTIKHTLAPSCGENDVLISIESMGICGSDLLFVEKENLWVKENVPNHQIIGHEFCGIVKQCGSNVSSIKIGDRVTAEGHIHCGNCNTCKAGLFNLCPNTKLTGYTAPGIFAEYVSLPVKQIHKVRTGITPDLAVFYDPIGNVLHAFSKISNIKGTDFLITGCGPIGLLCILYAKTNGARNIVVCDLSEFRLELALALGATKCILTDSPNSWNKLKMSDYFDKPSFLLECSGSNLAFLNAISILPPGSGVVMIGLLGSTIVFDFEHHVIEKGIFIIGITGRQNNISWESIGAFIYDNKIALTKVLTHRLSIHDYDKGFSLLGKGQSGKVVLYHDN